MNETTQTPTEKPTWRERLAAVGQRLQPLKAKLTTWWHAADTDRTGIAVALIMLLLALLVLTRTPGAKPAPQPDAIAPLAQRVAELETRLNALSTEPAQPAPSPDRSPDPAPARPGAPRAALRPTQPAAPAAAQPAWGTTDLDRAIAAFPSTFNQEPAK